ncbi:MAG: glycogen/starch/alpha-glucan phosphorylase [Ignavibacteriales bacterium]|nr:glycogen/starch/alpha-glucan phosphorylase [Ignavibacteriales bacterium]
MRDRVLEQRRPDACETYAEHDARVVAYLSAEFLPGPHLANNLLNLGITEPTRQALAELGLNLDDLVEQEEEPGLGNGGLGRLASCYLDSLASLEVPADRLRHPLRVRHLRPDHQGRLAGGDHRQVAALRQPVGNRRGRRSPTTCSSAATPRRGPTSRAGYRVRWVPDDGRQGRGLRHADPRLPRAAPATRSASGRPRRSSRSTSRPSTTATTTAPSRTRWPRRTSPRCSTRTTRSLQGKTLRLQQQFFFVTCSLQDMIRVHLLLRRPLDRFHEKWAVQLNDTHPAIAVAELMRLLVDEHAMDWDTAWHVTREHVRLHQPHAAARGAGEVAGRPVRQAPAAPPGDHLRDQPPLPRRGARAVPRRRGARGAHVAHRRERRALRAHGATSPPSAATTSTASPRCTPICCSETVHARLRRAVAGEVLQRHQRRHAAALRGRQQPAARRGSSPSRIGDGWLRDLGQLRQPRAAGRRRGVPAASGAR